MGAPAFPRAPGCPGCPVCCVCRVRRVGAGCSGCSGCSACPALPVLPASRLVRPGGYLGTGYVSCFTRDMKGAVSTCCTPSNAPSRVLT
ncbi:hypothetical protein GCM10018793_68870 [Streptomyces sulfonofaciens]|uniref:Uncharacterized protein n=1 Tax=Streptomyces sulfonofaciens TaxID=68272 RepID=A0A919GQZ2_9ACTN|nr:hypothetical protein GCM10018793_68870 [Streptomyces sulfonofaciens]